MTDILFDFRKGSGAPLEILFGTVSLKPTETHARGTSLVLPAPTVLDLVNGTATATNVSPTPAPVDGEIEWAYEVRVESRGNEDFEFLVGVPDSTQTVNFVTLPRYYETKPPLFGRGPQGIPGESATVAVGTVTSGTSPNVTNSGTSNNAVLDFVLPKGDKGDRGDGVPTGGTALQVVRKNAGNTATEWASLTKSLVGLGNVDNTSDVDKPVSTTQKTYIDQSNTLAYRSKLFADLPNTYPEGSTSFLGNISQDGWPNPSANNVSFVQVTTTRSRGYIGGMLQVITAYTDPEAPILYRIATSGNVWGEVQALPSKKGIEKATGVLNVKDYGAIGNGTTDDTDAIQGTIDGASGKTVFFPAGTYKVSPMVLSASNVTIEGAPGATITSTAGGNIFMFQGTVTAEKPLLWNISTGSTVVVVGADHGLAVGDWIYIKSQRDALGENAGDEWQLGYATPGSQGCYFAEFLQVSELTATDRVTVRQPVMFPSYRTDNTLETSASSRPFSTWQKVNFVENVTVKNLKASTGGQLLRTQWARNVVFEGITWTCAYAVGAMVLFQDSLECKAVSCEATYDTTMLEEVDHYKRNTFKSVGGHSCGFIQCKAVNGTQPFDFSYFSGGGPTVRGFVIDCETVGSQSNGMTSHGGTYILQVLNNRFHNLRHGPSIRTRNATISGNIIEGNGVADTIGIYLYEGWARDCIISNNNITGMDTGILIRDAVDEGETFKYVGALITGNAISKCLTGVQSTRSSGSSYWGERGVIIDSNHINLRDTTATRRGIWLGTGYRGVRITNNIIRNAGAPGTTSWGVYLNTNCTHNVIENNSFIDMYFGVEAVRPGSSSSGDGRIYASKNLFGTTSSSRHYVLDTGVVIWDGGWYGASQATRAPSPGTATGSDATVINALISSLRSRGLIS